MSGIFNCSNFLWMEPPDSSAARMPFPERTRLLAMSSRLSGVGAFLAMVFSSLRVRQELSLEFSVLMRASFKLSSTE